MGLSSDGRGLPLYPTPFSLIYISRPLGDRGRYSAKQMRRILIALLVIPLLLVGSCCALMTYTRSLPNGHSIQYANNSSCFIINRDYRVVVDDHIVSWAVDGPIVRGTMANGVKFDLDTNSSTATYSNGVTTSNGDAVKVRDLPNGYTLWSNGNSEHIIEPRTHFLVGPPEVSNVKTNDAVITGTDYRGMQFEIDTKSGLYKFRLLLMDGTIGWATLDEFGRTKPLNRSATNTE